MWRRVGIFCGGPEDDPNIVFSLRREKLPAVQGSFWQKWPCLDWYDREVRRGHCSNAQ